LFYNDEVADQAGVEEPSRDMGEMSDEEAEQNEESGTRKPMMKRQPEEPTKEEIEEHNINHTPFRSWCPQCVKARGRATHHKKHEEQEKAIPDFHIDYWFMRDHRGAELVPVANIKDGKSKTNKAHVVPGKGNAEGVAKKIVRDIEEMGYNGVISLKGDQENAIMDLIKEIQRLRPQGAIVEEAKNKDSQSNGMIERGIQSVEGIVRTMKLALEKKIGTMIPCNHPVMTWLVEHGAETLNRYHVGQDGRTAYERLKGKKYRGEMIEFGRKIFHRHPGRVEGGSMEPRWEEGIWLGKRVRSDEHIVACTSGKVMKARSIAMKPLSESWDAAAVMAVKATPWAPGGEKVGEEREGRRRAEEEVQDAVIVNMPERSRENLVPDPKVREPIPRDIYVMPKTLGKFGYTKKGCPKCSMMEKRDPRSTKYSHTDICRERIRKCMLEDQESQDTVKAADNRRGEYVARVIEDDDKENGSKKKARVAIEEKPEQKQSAHSGLEPEMTTGSSSSSSGTSPTTSTNPGSAPGTTITSSASSSGSKPTTTSSVTGKRGRVAEEDEEERSRPTGFQTTEGNDDESDAEMENTGINNVNIAKSRGGSQQYDNYDEGLRRSMVNEDRRARGKYTVVEIFSPPRVCERARERGIAGGWSLDWMHQDPITGQKWDLRRRHVQDKVLMMLRRDKPGVVVACPPCTLFSQLQNLSEAPQTRVPEKWAEAVEMVNFAAKVCTEQMKAGRKFVFEHPLTATSWSLESLVALRKTAGVFQATTHMCAFGMKSRDVDGEGLVLKPTRFLTNSEAIKEKLDQKCNRGHRHVHLISGRAAAAAEYPKDLIDAILDGYEVENYGKLYNVQKAMEEMNVDGLHEEGVQGWEFIDDTTGKVLNKKLVSKARILEMKTFREMKVYEYAERREVERSGGKLVGVRWVDVMKGDDVRSRLVAQEYAGKNDREDLFAGTPPLAATKMVISSVASRQGKQKHKLMILDIKRAFLYGDIEETIFIELPDEDPMKEKGMVGRLKKAMYGTRAAPQVWQEVVKKTMEKRGFRSSRSSPCVYYHPQRHLKVVTHVDDFICGGAEEDLRWLKRELQKEFELKYQIMGDDINDCKEATFLGRTIRWENEGISYEADQKHVQILLKEEDMEGAKPVSTPGVAEEKNIDNEGSESDMNNEGATKYRRAVARINYLALDRPDLSFAAKELSRSMAKPKAGDTVRLKRALRYLKGNARRKMWYRWQGEVNKLDTYTDSDWAGCMKTRRSTSGGLIMKGTHLIAHWAATQATVALSVAEAELNAIVKAASESIGVKHMGEDFGEELKIEVHTDSSSAKGIVHRKGCGKIKHLEARQLWVQEVVSRKLLNISKIPRSENPSDALTHHWLAVEGAVHFYKLGLYGTGIPDGRSKHLQSEGGC